LRRDPCVKAKTGFLSQLGKAIIIFPGWDGLQREYLASLPWSNCDAVADRTAQYLLHRIFITLFQIQVSVFFLPFQVLAPEGKRVYLPELLSGFKPAGLLPAPAVMG